jgi:1A family penicillin-binding protein
MMDYLETISKKEEITVRKERFLPLRMLWRRFFGLRHFLPLNKRKFVILNIVFFAFGAVIGMNLAIISGLPDVDSLANYEPKLSTGIYDINDELIIEVYEHRRIPVVLDSLPEYIPAAVVSLEDKRFYSHFGIDLKRLTKVIGLNVIRKMGGRKWGQGASTITQQLSRNIFLTLQKTLLRKIEEIYLSLLIERRYSKKEILEMYLNEIYWGYGNHGIGAASRYYFGKVPDSLSVSETAALVGLLSSPGSYSPYNSYQRFVDRRNLVLSEMLQEKAILKEQFDSAIAESLEVVDHSKEKIVGPYFINEVKREMEELFGRAYISWGGYKVYTTMNQNMQILADSLLEVGLKRVEKTWGIPPKSAIPDSLIHPDNIPYLQGAMVVMDPATGYVLSLVGGRDYKHSLYNRAIQGKTQVGSAFKPFLFTAAIDNGFLPSDFVFDLPMIKEVAGEVYAPKNYDNTFLGKISLRTALARSRNVASLNLTREVGAFSVVEYAYQMGIESELQPVLSVALGTSDISLLEMVRAFSTIANLGERINPIFIRQVVDRYGNVVYENRIVKQRVLSEATAYVVLDMMRSVFDDEGGTATAARALGFTKPAAGKTGTTDDFKYAWFIGFVKELIAGVWVGFDYPRVIGNRASGGAVALPIWTDFMRAVCDSTMDYDFFVPESVEFRYICTESGELATSKCPNVRKEVFRKGDIPKTQCQLHGEGKIKIGKPIEMLDDFNF